jgi:PAS domain S-box-containing protein
LDSTIQRLEATIEALSSRVNRLERENAELRERLDVNVPHIGGSPGRDSLFRLLAEAMPQLVWTCTSDGQCDYLGPQWVAYTGTSEAEQLGYGWLQKVHPEDRERVHAEWTRAAADGAAFDKDFRILRSDGEYRWFKTRAVPSRDAMGRITQWLGTNTDIQDLREAETEVRRLKDNLEREVAHRTAQLQAVSERLLTATSAANLGIWEWDLESDQVVWDERTYQLYGLQGTEPGDPTTAWRSAVYTEDRAAVAEAIALAISGSGTFDATYRISTSEAAPRHLRAIATVTRDPHGKALRMLGIVSDVTTQILAQEQLRINAERWNLALQGGGDGVWDWDLVKNEIFLSHRSREILGYTGEEVAKLETRATVIHPEDAPRTNAELERHLRGETPAFDCEYRLRCIDGSYRWVQGSGRVIARDAAGKPLRIVGTHKDIAERRRAREVLENREALLREFITHTPAAIAMLDRDMRYVQASRRWLSDYKLHGQEVIGRSHYDVFPDIPARWKQIHQRVLAGAVESCEEDPFFRADGRTEWLQWEARPWHENSGEVGGLIFFTQVITERKELGIRLEEQNRQLARSNSELEQFAYVASHDLQEPLRAIAGCTQILAQRYRGRLDAGADTLIAHIVDGSARMKALIEGLLSLSKVGAHRHAPTSVDASDIFEQAVRNLDVSINEQGAKVEAGPLPRVMGEGTELLQLFQNLIGNALKYRGLAPPVVVVNATTSGNFQQFTVADNGIGIDPQYFERIFGVFQRLHTREEYPGTGIGLAICRKIVERHGGRLWLQSSPNCGSTFCFTLPAERAEKAAS